MYRIILPLFLFSLITQAYGNFCNTNLSKIDPKLAGRKQEFALKVIIDQQDEVVWLTKHTGYFPDQIKKKKILEDGKVFIAIPFKINDERIFIKLEYKHFTDTIDADTVEKTFKLKDINAVTSSGAKRDLDKETVDAILEFTKDAKPGELVKLQIAEDSYIEMVPRISNNSLTEYTNFMKTYLYLAERNAITRPFHKLTSITDYRTLKLFKRKLFPKNAVAFVRDRLRKQFVSIGLVSLGSYITYKITDRQNEVPFIKMHSIEKDQKEEFEIRETKKGLKFIPENQKDYINKDSVEMKDPDKKNTYKFQVEKDSLGTIYLEKK